MTDHIENRNRIIEALREELVGPAKAGTELDVSGNISFASWEESYGPWIQMGSGEEILIWNPPLRRYGVGVLHPAGAPLEEQNASEQITELSEKDEMEPEDDDSSRIDPLTTEGKRSIDKISEKISKTVEKTARDESDDFDLSTTNAYSPSSIAISFLVNLPENASLKVIATGGRYVPKTVRIMDIERTWWLRKPVKLTATFEYNQICSDACLKVKPAHLEAVNLDDFNLSIELFSRPASKADNQSRLVTVCLINRYSLESLIKRNARRDVGCLFQSGFEVSAVTEQQRECILPYPKPPGTRFDQEEESLDLLYHDVETFAVGHGCAADWSKPNKNNRVGTVIAECLPYFETPSITPDIVDNDGNPVQVPMAPLGGMVEGNDGFGSLARVVSLYEAWIEIKETELTKLAPRYQDAAVRHIAECRNCADRMKEGIEYLKINEKAFKAFQMANKAILLQQIRSRPGFREYVFDPKTKSDGFSEEYPEPDPLAPAGNRGYWRAFQIAFQLMNVRSVAEHDSPDRDRRGRFGRGGEPGTSARHDSRG